MAFISKLQIERFRGIKNLCIDALSRVNLVVGDNNCGKTSLFEALLLLKVYDDPSYLYRLGRLRAGLGSNVSNSVYEDIVCMFPAKNTEAGVSLAAVCRGKSVSYKLSGTEGRILVSADEIEKLGHIMRAMIGAVSNETETDVFNGAFVLKVDGTELRREISFSRLSLLTGMPVQSHNRFNIAYLAPFAHFGRTIDEIVKNAGYKQLCIEALQLFDKEIEDILYLKSDITNQPVEYVRHKQLGNMPLATYGDGIKKVLALANAVMSAAGGILLVDEVETSIHKKYYADVFGFLVRACKQFDVQLFVSTHSIEAMDGFLASQAYCTQETGNAEDEISVVTLKRDNGNSYARVLSGREVFKAREDFDFEARL